MTGVNMPIGARRHPHTIALLFLLAAASLGGCSPEFMQGMANGMAAYNASAYGSTGSSGSSERVCVKYETQSGWSDGYQVTGTVISGTDLNAKTGSYSYSPYSTYVVVFWDKGQASVLQLGYYSGSITAYGHTATDQRGRKWHVSKTSYC